MLNRANSFWHLQSWAVCQHQPRDPSLWSNNPCKQWKKNKKKSGNCPHHSHKVLSWLKRPTVWYIAVFRYISRPPPDTFLLQSITLSLYVSQSIYQGLRGYLANLPGFIGINLYTFSSFYQILSILLIYFLVSFISTFLLFSSFLSAGNSSLSFLLF